MTNLLNGQPDGDSGEASLLYQRVYSELRRIAARQLRQERANHTLQPTALVNEAWMRLNRPAHRNWQSRAHFLASAAQVMRHVLIDEGRQKRTLKRNNGGVDGMALAAPEEFALQVSSNVIVSHIDIERALRRLEKLDERLSRIVEMRFYGGMSDEEVAEVLQVSARTIKRDWKKAKGWLRGELREHSVSMEGRVETGP